MFGLIKYFNTVRYLKISQICWRIYFLFTQASINLNSEFKTNQITEKLSFLTKSNSLERNGFMFLGEFGEIRNGNWQCDNYSKLWCYNLHYFDFINSRLNKDEASRCTELINTWIDDNPVNFGIGWEPYPTSLRIVNWIKWSINHSNFSFKHNYSLLLQTRALNKKLEKHLLGNHILANAKALIFSGLYFSGCEAKKWLQLGTKIISEELSEQILEDGAHFELSPMYHSVILEDLIDIFNIFKVFQVSSGRRHLQLIESIEAKISVMLIWLEEMIHPDEEISFFNDSAIGIAHTFKDLKNYALTSGIELKEKTISEDLSHLKDSGYIRLNLQDAIFLLDVAHVGPDYIPGHAHADTLSFEASIHEKRLIVNSGTSCYGLNKERHRQRSTKSHSTVEIDNKNSSEVWSSFRVAKRAYPKNLEINCLEKKISCSHDGYASPVGGSIHTRVWDFSTRNKLIINDKILGKFSIAKAMYHIHPDWNLSFDNKVLSCSLETLSVEIRINKGEAVLKSSTYHPSFGLSIANNVLEIAHKNGHIEVEISWI